MALLWTSVSISERDLQQGPGVAAWGHCQRSAAREVGILFPHQASLSGCRGHGPSCPAPRGQAERLSACSRPFCTGWEARRALGLAATCADGDPCILALRQPCPHPTTAPRPGPSREGWGRGPRLAPTCLAVRDHPRQSAVGFGVTLMEGQD